MPAEQSVIEPYGSSNAPNYSPPVGYQVNPRTGALQISIKPPPLFGFLGEAATPRIQYSQNASFLNRQILHLPLGWLYPYSFILDSKVYVNGGPSFFIDQGYASGMRYYTLKDAVFEDFGDPQPFPYDKGRSFTCMLRFTTGNRQYLDAYGRLIGMDDRFGNHVIFEYDGDGDVIASRISRIIDSLGQATLFAYASGHITVTYPRGGNNAIEFSFLLDDESYLVGYVDPLGHRTTIESHGGLVRHDLVSRVAYPNGLEVKYDYGSLRFYLPGRGQFHRLDCVVGVRATSAGVTRTVTYDFDPDDTAHNFTGYPTYYVDSQADRLLESGDNEYRYRVQIDDGILITEHAYNRLHLELETRTLTRESRRLVNHVVKNYPGEMSDGRFPLYVNLRRDFPNYQAPRRVRSETYNDDGQKRRYVVETDLNLYGQPQEIRSYRSDSQPSPVNLLWKQVTTYDYPTEGDRDHYGIVLLDERWDYTRAPSAAVEVRRTVNTLTKDRKNIEASATAFVTGGTFAPDTAQRFAYDARGRVTLEEIAWTDEQKHSPERSQRWTAYQIQVPTVTTAIRNVLNQATTIVSDSTTGWTTSVTNAVGASVTYTYDNAGRRLTQTDPLGVVTRWSYDKDARKVTTRFANGYETYVYHNGFGDEIATADNGLPGGGERTLSTKSYNALGQLVWEQGVLGEASRLRYEYDDCGRLAATTDALGNVTGQTYNTATQTQTTLFNGYKVDETVSADEVSTIYTYSTRAGDDRIESTSIINSFDLPVLGRLGAAGSRIWAETTYEYDAALVLRRYAARGADGITGGHDIERDLFGNVRQETVEIEFPGRTPYVAKGDLAQYNELNQLVEDRNPIGQSSQYTYDAAGRQETFTDYSGTVFRSQYLANNQVDAVSYQEDAQTRVEKRFRYDPLTHLLTSIEEIVGDRSVGAVSRSYKRDGSLESVTYPDGKKVLIAYDDRYARISSVTDALGITTVYGYDGWGRLQSAEIAGVGQRVEFDYYDRSEDAANSGSLKSTTTNGSLRRTYRYDGFGSVGTILYADVRTGAPKELLSVELSYVIPTRNLSRVVCRSASMPTHPALNRRAEYTYNSLNQLTRGKVAILPDGAITTVDFEYDAANNVTREVRTDASGVSSTTTYTYDADNRLLQVDEPVGSAKLAYDENGNVVDDGLGATYRYDKKGKLVRYSHERLGVDYIYTYYANELRATKLPVDGDSIRYYYDGSSVPDITNEVQSGAEVSYLLAGGERLLRNVRESGQTAAQHLITGAKDVTAVLGADLDLQAAYDYAPYGAQAQGSALTFGVKANPFQYTRQYTDAESELIYLRSRYYHPRLQRFLTRDTATLLNRYNYGDGNPINGVDPTGEIFGVDDFLVALAISAIIGAAVGAAIGGATTRSWKGAGFGALAGFVGGATAFTGATAITGALAAAGAATGFAVEEAGTVVGFVVGAATGAAGDAAGGAAGQAVANLAGDHGDVGQAALLGAVLGFGIGGATGARATFTGVKQGMELREVTHGSAPRLLNSKTLPAGWWSQVSSEIRGANDAQHEWLEVEHFGRWRAMGYTIEEIRSNSMRTPTKEVEFEMAGDPKNQVWRNHRQAAGHRFYNEAVGKTRGVLSLHKTVRGLSNRIRVNRTTGALPSAFHGFLPPVSRLIRMPFSIAYGVQGRVWLPLAAKSE